MKRITFILLTTIFTSAFANAQNSMSLDQCVQYALENHNSIKNAELDVKSAKASIGETRAIGLPQVNGKWDWTDNLQVQSQYLPARFINPMAPEDAVISTPFGIQYNSNMSVTASQLLFDGSYIIGLKAAKTYKDLVESTVSKTKSQVASDVSKAYYLVLITNERIKQVEDNEKLLTQLLSDTKILKEAGMVEDLDLKRTNVNLNNLKVEIQKLKTLKTITLNLLKFQMGMPQNEELTLTDKLENVVVTEEAGTVNYESNPDYRLLGIQKDLNRLNLQNEKIRLLPSLAAFYNGGLNYGTNDFGSTFSFGDYTNYHMLGVTLNVPIFSSGQRKYRIDQAKVEITKTENNLAFLEQTLDMQYYQHKSSLTDQLAVLKIRKENKDLAEEVYNTTKIRYEEGMASNFEVLSSQTDLKTAQTDYYNALYDALVSKIELDIISGKFVPANTTN